MGYNRGMLFKQAEPLLTKPMGTIIVLMEPNGISEDEFHDWYDNEHIADRRKIEGCLTIERFICTDGWPRYLCLYDWDTLDVLRGDAYKAIHDTAKRTPWTVRILARTRGFERLEANQIYPGRAQFAEKGKATRLLMARIHGVVAERDQELIEKCSQFFDRHANILQWRLFRTHGKKADEHWLCVEFGAIWNTSFAGLSLPSGAVIDLANLYAPYWRSP